MKPIWMEREPFIWKRRSRWFIPMDSITESESISEVLDMRFEKNGEKKPGKKK